METASIWEMFMVPMKLMYALLMFTLGTIHRFILVLLWGKRRTKVIKAAITRELKCPEGCPPQPADGIWECKECGANRTGWVWAKCPVCKQAGGYVPCGHCGMAIVNPEIK